MLPSLPGIYRILNTVNDKCYVGQSKDLRDRARRHWSALATNRHSNAHLQSAYNRYGKDSFLFEVLEIVPFPSMLSLIECREYLRPYEQKWIDHYNSAAREHGYNLAPSAATNLGVVRSPETRAKLSAINKGKKATLETRRKLSAVRTGRVQSEATRLLLSEQRTKYTYIVGLPDGEEAIVRNLKQFCRDYGLSPSGMSDVLHGHRKQHYGYTVRYVTSILLGDMDE